MADNRLKNNESQDQQVQQAQQGEIQKEEECIVNDDTLYTIERMCLYGDAIE